MFEVRGNCLLKEVVTDTLGPYRVHCGTTVFSSPFHASDRAT